MRIALVPTNAEAFERHRREGRTPQHLIRTVAHVSPRLLEAWLSMAYALRQDTTLSPYTRELVVVRVTQLAACEYEFSHHFEEAQTVGVSSEKLGSLSEWRIADCFSQEDRALLRLVDELTVQRSAADETVADAGRHFSEQALVELAVLVGFYGCVASLLNAFDVPLEPDRPSHAALLDLSTNGSAVNPADSVFLASDRSQSLEEE